MHVPRQLIKSVISGVDRLRRIELTSFGDLLRRDFFCFDFSPASASTGKCGLQIIVIDKINVEIANTRDNRLDIYFHLVANGQDVGVFGDPSY